MKKQITLLLLLTATSVTAKAQLEEVEPTLPEKNEQRIEAIESSLSKLNKLKISGYIQAQWQLAESAGIAAFQDGGSFNANTINRFSVRRGRIKFTYTSGIAQFVLQPDITDKGVSVKDAYLAVTDLSKTVSGTLGLFDRPFGYEINYSSSVRESPERSRVFLSLFPGERDLGAMLSLSGNALLQGLKLDAALTCGNGIGVETDSRKDFIGRLSYEYKGDDVKAGAALSYYNGGVLNPVDTSYSYKDGTGFEASTNSVKGEYNLRQYFGIGATFTSATTIGTTKLTAEYLFGDQPGTKSANADPGGTSFGAGTAAIYNRQFAGFYAMLAQDIGETPHTVVLKYDFYDPNTKVAGNDIGSLTGTGAADIAYNTFGFGYILRLTENVRFTVYYDMPTNETSTNLKGYEERIKQNVLTLRTQVKF